MTQSLTDATHDNGFQEDDEWPFYGYRAKLEHAIEQAKDSAIGTARPDGALYAGKSYGTGTPLYVKPALTLTDSWQAAQEQKEFTLPTEDQLEVLFQNRAKLGLFKENAPTVYLTSEQLSQGGIWAWQVSEGGKKFTKGVVSENTPAKIIPILA